MMDLDRADEAAAVRPSARQIAWQRLEFYGFLHFGMNTMTDVEWGLGHESPTLFDPEQVDADQWVAALASAGMNAVILTCKHHDGFCLWPSALTAHSVANSPWRDGEGDLVAEVADACRRHGLRFGVYLSPWDRTESTYGSGADYDDYFVGQLTELLTSYGPLFCVWLDGACGEGPGGQRQVYDWDRYFEVVRRLQPDAVISVCGPDVRWCGNEAGHTRTDEWSVVPASLRDAERTASLSQQTDDPAFARLVRSDQEDLGSRAALAASDEPLVWYPAEVNTSIRPGWFHHPAEDESVRSSAELFDIYRRSVGGNSTFLLNVPPARHGTIHSADVAVLSELGEMIAGLKTRDITESAECLIDGVVATAPHDDVVALLRDGSVLSLRWPRPREISGIVIGEDIVRGQQIDELVITAEGASGEPVKVASAGSVGYKRIVDVPDQFVTAVHIRIVKARGDVALTQVAVLEPAPQCHGEDDGNR